VTKPKAPLVALLRTPERPVDPYEAALEAAGFCPVSIPILDFEPAGEEVLTGILRRPEAYEGVILTSPRAASRLVEALERTGFDTAAWRKKTLWTVGPATAAIAAAAQFDPQGEDNGEAARLAERIVMYPATRPWLFLCGDRRRDTLPEALRQARTPFEELIVYHTRERVPDWSACSSLDWVVFFSPLGVEAAMPVSETVWKGAQTAAIGPTTAVALRDAGRPAAAVAEQPTPAALVAALGMSVIP
jgi:uroporphyrinogen-III synthase